MTRLWCCGCNADVSPRLTNGGEIYPHRPDLKSLPFWKCDTCKNFVGCHHKTKAPTTPLGCIPTPEIKKARQELHLRIDPIWKSGLMTRSALYRSIADRLGVKEYHTAEIRSTSDAANVLTHVNQIAQGLSL